MDKKHLVSLGVAMSLGFGLGRLDAAEPKKVVLERPKPKPVFDGGIQNLIIIGDGRRCDFDKLAAKLPFDEACEAP